jgi:hypothetical protein
VAGEIVVETAEDERAEAARLVRQDDRADPFELAVDLAGVAPVVVVAGNDDGGERGGQLA